jgi:hypothetical protein
MIGQRIAKLNFAQPNAPISKYIWGI